MPKGNRAPNDPSGRHLRVGRFLFAIDTMTLFDGDTVVRIPRRSCELLGFLIQNAGRVVTKDEIFDTVWADTFVEESNLSHHIAVLRKALGSSVTFIETVPRCGYRFVAPVTPVIEPRALATTIELEDAPETLFGRRSEIGDLAMRLGSGLRLITLTGPGGVGKTSLAREVVRQAEPDFRDGVEFVDLSETSSALAVAETIANQVGIKESGSDRADANVISYFSNRRVLLVLDNFEHVLSARPLVKRLLDECPDVSVMITSRVRLGMHGEIEFAVGPLPIPQPDDGPEEIRGNPAVMLFAERAKWARPGFVISEEAIPVVGDICRTLDGLPLAIELAAPRVKLMSLAAIRSRLADQLAFLTTTGADLPERHQTISGSIEWSYRLLTASQRQTFELLAVFHGAFGLEAAEEVTSAVSPETPLLDDLEVLIDSNLLMAFETPEGEVRFRFLQPILEFARSKLEASKIVRTIREAHAAYFAGLARECEKERLAAGGLSDGWVSRLTSESDNLRETAAFLAETGNPELLGLVGDLHLWWIRRGRFSEARRLLTQALAAFPELETPARGVALKAAAMVACKQGDYSAGLELYHECRRLGESLRDLRLTSIARNGIGTVLYLTGEIPEAKSVFNALLPDCERLGDPNLQSSVIINLTEIARIEGDYRTAVDLGRKTIGHGIATDDGLMLCGTYVNLASSLFCLGEFEESDEFYRSATEIADRLSLKAYRSVCLDGLAALALRCGERDRAREFAREADELRTRIGYELELPDRIFRETHVDPHLRDRPHQE